jgi:radical SAM protein with 4Fe4S-binding SPASM domain
MTPLSHKLAFIKKLSPRKLNNAFQVYRSFHSSRKNGTADMKGMPIGLAIEPTTACNLRCPECPSGLRSFSRNTGNLDQKMFEKVIEDQKKTLVHLTFYFQGEPFIHKGFLDMVKFASDRGIYTSTSTNAHFLDEKTCEKVMESRLDRMIISIDGTDQETYSQYRKGGTLSKVLEGTENMVRARKNSSLKGPELVFQFLVVKPNEHQIEDVKKLAKKIGVDRVAFKTAQLYDFEQGNELMPTQDKYSRYRWDAGLQKFRIKNTLEDQCWKMWHSCVITWDGHVVPCCFDKDAAHRMGSVQETPLSQIWKGPVYDAFRSQILESRDQVEMCKNCSEGTRVFAS